MTVLGRAFPGFTLSACIVVYVFRGKLIYNLTKNGSATENLRTCPGRHTVPVSFREDRRIQ
jgi:hypothetical protein